MTERKQKFLTYLLCLTLLGSTVIFSDFAYASDSSMQDNDSPPATAVYTQIEDEPRFFQMMGDLLIARPLLLAATAVGTGIFVVSLPFSLLGGNAKEAANTLVIGPARQTFVRCLGCPLISSEY